MGIRGLFMPVIATTNRIDSGECGSCHDGAAVFPSANRNRQCYADRRTVFRPAGGYRIHRFDFVGIGYIAGVSWCFVSGYQ